MKVEAAVYYHIHHISDAYRDLISKISSPYQFDVGTRFFWGGERLNFFNEFYNHRDFLVNYMDTPMDTIDALLAYDKLPPDERQKSCPDLMLALSRYAKNAAICTRETIFEDMRSQHYPDRPSRKTCLWVCSRSQIGNWWASSFSGQRKLLKLGLTGTIHRGDNQFLKIGAFAHNRYRENAHRYWAGCNGPELEHEECLFQGQVDVIAEYEDPASIENVNNP